MPPFRCHVILTRRWPRRKTRLHCSLPKEAVMAEAEVVAAEVAGEVAEAVGVQRPEAAAA